MVTPIRLYPLHCTLYYCTLTPTLTRRQLSAPVTISPAFVSDFCFKFCSVHSIGYTFHSTFCLRFRLEISSSFFPNSVFLLEVRRELPQRSTLNTFFVALSFLVARMHSLSLLALNFLHVSHSNLLIFVLFQTYHTFVSSSFLLPYSSFQFLFFVGRVPNKPLDFASFF